MTNQTCKIPRLIASIQKHVQLSNDYLLENKTALASEQIQNARHLLELLKSQLTNE